MGTGWRREFLALKRQEGDLTDGKKENIILLFNARFAHFLTHEKDLRASPKIMEDVERYHKDIQR